MAEIIKKLHNSPWYSIPVGCPINDSDKLPVQRQTDRQTDRPTDPGATKTIDLRAPKDMNKNYYVILTSKKFAVQIKHLEINCVISEEDRKKKLQKFD